MSEEIKINIRDMLFGIMKHWRSIFVGLIIGAVLMNLYQVRSEIQESASISPKEQMEVLRAGLSETERSEAEHLYSIHQQYADNYQSELEYRSQSIKMQLDANCVPTMNLQYYINCGEMESSDIISAFTAIIYDSSTLEPLMEELGVEKENYVAELITVSNSYGAAGEKNTAGSEVTGGSFRQETKHNLIISIRARNQDEAEMIAGHISRAVTDASDDLNQVYGTFTVSLAAQNYYENVDTVLREEQKNQMVNLNSVHAYQEEIGSELTGAQKQYFDELCAQQIDLDADITADDIPDEVQKIEYLHGKYMLLGGILGAFVVCCYFIAAFVMSRRLRSVDDMNGFYHIPVLGFAEDRKKKGLDAFLLRMQYRGVCNYSREERLQMIASGIEVAAKKNRLQKVMILSSGNAGTVNTWKEAVVQQLRDGNVKMVTGSSVLYDPKTLEELAECDGAVLVEKLGDSYYEDIQKVKEICNSYSVKLIGSVVVEA